MTENDFRRGAPNLEKKPEVDLQIRGYVVGPIKVSPKYLSLGKVPENLGEPIVKTLITRHDNGKRFKITKITCSAPQFTFDTKLHDRNTYHITVTYKGGLPVGHHPGLIHIETDDRDQPNFDIGYSITVTRAE